MLRSHQIVGAGSDSYDVIAAGRYHDRDATSRLRDGPHQPRVDPGAPQRPERNLGKSIRPDGAGEHHLGAGEARRQGLVGALAARQQRVITAEHGLAGLRQAGNRNEQIDVDRA